MLFVHYDAEVGKTGLKGTQYSLLSYVVKLGPIRPVELAQAMGVEAEGPISNPNDLGAAIRRGIDAVKQGRPYLIDVVTQSR